MQCCCRLNNVSIDEYGKDVFRYMLGGASDLELVNISFRTPGYFFSGWESRKRRTDGIDRLGSEIPVIEYEHNIQESKNYST